VTNGTRYKEVGKDGQTVYYFKHGG